MISAWTVYWVMQMDSIVKSMVILSAFGMFGGWLAITFGYSENIDKSIKAGKWMICIGSLAFIANTFLPTTKTVAAMIVLPAITSDVVVDTVTPEARELYKLAKDALTEMGKKEPTKESENAEK